MSKPPVFDLCGRRDRWEHPVARNVGYDIHADFNSDGLLDSVDFVLWINSYGAMGDP